MKIEISITAKTICLTLACLCGLFVAIGLYVITRFYSFEPPGAYLRGLLAGTLLSAIKVVLMEKTLNRAADMSEFKGARKYGALQVSLRNMLTLSVFVLVLSFREIFGLYGTIIGVLSLQPAAFITGIILRKDTKKV